MSVEYLLTGGRADVRTEIESLDARVFSTDRCATRNRKPMQRLALLMGGFENVRHMPFRNDERMKRTHGKFVSNGESEIVLADQSVRLRITEWTIAAQDLRLRPRRVATDRYPSNPTLPSAE